jgi:type VI protein secretion system component VasK
MGNGVPMRVEADLFISRYYAQRRNRCVVRLIFINLLASPLGPPTEPSPKSWMATMLIALGIALMAILVSVSARSKMAKREAERLTPRERIDQLKAEHARKQIDSAPLAAHMDRIQEFATMLDNKAERLEQLIAEADERIALLRAHTCTAAPPQKSPPDGSASPSSQRTIDPLARSVYELADAGRSSVEIAQELDEQVGKVDLILALRGR